MEFLKLYEYANQQGIAKQEFLHIWETESKIKMMTEEAKVLELKQRQQINSTPMPDPDRDTKLESLIVQSGRKHDEAESKMETLMHQIIQQVHNLRLEVLELGKSNEKSLVVFGSQQQQLQDQFSQCQQQQFQQHVALAEELSSHFCKLNENLVNNFNDLKNSSTWEVEKAKEISVGKENATVPLAEVIGRVVNVKIENKGGEENETYNNKDNYLLQETSDNLQANTSILWQEEAFEKLSSGDEAPWNVVVPRGRSVKQNVGLVDIGFDEVAKTKRLSKSSFATGTYAEAISYMLSTEGSLAIGKDVNPVINGSDKSGKKGNHTGLGDTQVAVNGRREPTSKTPSITYIPDGGAEFFIPNIKKFQMSNNDFMTESFYTRPKACKVRLRLWFNKRGRLGVHILVSEGVLDDHHKWPIIFDGEGYIYNQSSQAYTKLWAVESQPCGQPSKKKEEPLGVSVCLSTSRDPTEDVTYDLLHKKHYVADGDRLLFKWFLQAKEG